MNCPAICDECETVNHCSKNGCIPKVPMPRASYLLLKVEHTKPIPDITDAVAGRTYNYLKATNDVQDVTASLIDERDALQLQATLDLWMEGRARHG